jgi:hypothetical protein
MTDKKETTVAINAAVTLSLKNKEKEKIANRQQTANGPNILRISSTGA